MVEPLRLWVNERVNQKMRVNESDLTGEQRKVQKQ